MPIRVINFNEISTNPKIYVSNHTIDVWLRYAMVKSTSCITIHFMNMSQLTERTFTPSESLSSLSLFLSLHVDSVGRVNSGIAVVFARNFCCAR